MDGSSDNSSYSIPDELTPQTSNKISDLQFSTKSIDPDPSGTSSLNINNFREYDYSMIRKKLNWLFELKNPSLDDEFNRYFQRKKSIGFLLFSNIIITLILLPASAILLHEDILHFDSADSHTTQFIMSIIAVAVVCLGVLAGWLIFFLQKDTVEFGILSYYATIFNLSNEGASASCVHRLCACLYGVFTIRKPESNVLYSSEIQPDRNLSVTHYLTQHQTVISHLYVILFLIYFMIAFIRRSTLPDCNSHGYGVEENYPDFLLFLGAGHCTYGRYLGSSMMGNGLAMIMIPLLYFSNFPELNMVVVWCSIGVIIALYLIICGIVGSFATAPLIILWTLAAAFVLVDIQVRNIIIFLTNRKLHAIVMENERLADEMRANEMRHMIANVAHDLKTPLSSFTTGLDFIQLTMSDCYSKLQVNREDNCFEDAYQTVLSCLTNIRNTNSFMLMTINRCIDYTKASKGLKLVPRYETVHLLDTLQLPLNCMQNIQQRIEIQLHDLSGNICSHIITDKLWLQENILCLLSNAVKYSSTGLVTISVFLEKIVQPVATKPFFTTSFFFQNGLVRDETEEIGEDIDFTPPAATHLSPKRSNSSTPSSLAIGESQESKETVENIRNKEKKFASRSASLHSFDTLDHFQLNSPKVGYLKEEDIKRHEVKMHLRFEIEDTGIGMTDEAMLTLFNPFKQTQRLAGGTGLGLYSLAKRVEALQGKYGVMKRRDGQNGSLFWFSIPYRPDEVTAELERIDEGDPEEERFTLDRCRTSSPKAHHRRSYEMPVIELNQSTRKSIHEKMDREHFHHQNSGLKIEVFNEKKVVEAPALSEPLVEKPLSNPPFRPPPISIPNSNVQLADTQLPTSRVPIPSTPSSSTPIIPPLHILLVDDAPSIIKMTTMMLKRLGHTITDAENGEVAVRMVHERWFRSHDTYDLILMDLQMPVMDGLEATRRIRKLEEGIFMFNPSMFESKDERDSDKDDSDDKNSSIESSRPNLLGSPRTPSFATIKQLLSPKLSFHSKNSGGNNSNSQTPRSLSVVSSGPSSTASTPAAASAKQSYQDKFPHQVIIGMSANSDSDTTSEAYVAGVDVFMPKPFNVDTFARTVSKLPVAGLNSASNNGSSSPTRKAHSSSSNNQSNISNSTSSNNANSSSTNTHEIAIQLLSVTSPKNGVNNP